MVNGGAIRVTQRWRSWLSIFIRIGANGRGENGFNRLQSKKVRFLGPRIPSLGNKLGVKPGVTLGHQLEKASHGLWGNPGYNWPWLKTVYTNICCYIEGVNREPLLKLGSTELKRIFQRTLERNNR